MSILISRSITEVNKFDFEAEELQLNRMPAVSTPRDDIQQDSDFIEEDEIREISKNILIGSYNAMNDIFN